MPPTIIDLKTAFLQSQLRILNAPLEPSAQWRENGPTPKQGELKDELIQEATYKLNTIVRHHNRTVYSAQALRHVAEQIDALYWAAGAPDPRPGDANEGAVGRGADLRDHETIVTLPEEWTDENNRDESGLEQFADSSRYKTLRSRLLALTERRAARKIKLAQLRQLQQLLLPFHEAEKYVQPNLVTKDGELARELERMKVLIARVSEKLGSLPVRNNADEGERMEGVEELDPKRKIDLLLANRPVELRED